MRRSLLKDIRSNLRAILVNCSYFGELKIPPGRKKKRHIINLANNLANMLEILTKENFSLSLNFHPETGNSQEFTSPGPFFVQKVCQTIDPSLTISEIKSALRQRSSKPTGETELP